MVSLPQVSLPKPCAHLPLPPYVLLATPISFFLILSPAQYWVRSTDHVLRFLRKYRTHARTHSHTRISVCLVDSIMTQDSCRPFNAEDRIQYQVFPCRDFRGKNGTVTRISPITSVSPVSSFHQCSHTHYSFNSSITDGI